MNDGWEETGIAAKTIEPCGKDLVYMGLEEVKDEQGNEAGYKLRVRDMLTGQERTSAAEPFAEQTLIGCTPDSRYLLIGTYLKNVGNSINAYDTETMKMIGTFAYHDEAGLTTQRLSPDGRYLLAGEKESSFPLPDGRRIQVLPALLPFRSRVTSVAWSGDSAKAYILTKSGPQNLIIYDVATSAQRTIELAFGPRDYFGMRIMVHPKTERVFIHTGLSFDGEIEFIEYLFMFDPAQLPKKGNTITVKPQLLGDIFATVAFGPDNTLLFSLMPNQEASTPAFPEKYKGIFMADLDGKVIGRITKDHYDLEPAYMDERRLLVISRENRLPFNALYMRTIMYWRNSSASIR
ncbi:MAG: hypothetical protein HZA04_05235 [Nitrospinae bacterium]|nr:hypothetical protein [Nitrospinota bacterium]